MIVFIIIFHYSLYAEKKMAIVLALLNSLTTELCPKLCWHNLPNPSGGLASHSMGEGGGCEFWYSLVLHESPIKILSNWADPLACFKDLSHPCGWTTIQSRGGGGGVVIFLSWCFTSLQLRQAFVVQALWFVLNTFLVQGSRLPSNPLRGEGVGVELLHGALCYTIALQAF